MAEKLKRFITCIEVITGHVTSNGGRKKLPFARDIAEQMVAYLEGKNEGALNNYKFLF